MALVKISANISEDVVQDLKRRADKKGISMTEMLRQALATQKFLEEEVDSGTTVLLEKRGKRDREFVPGISAS